MSIRIKRDLRHEDIPLIRNLLQKVFGKSEYRNLSRLGGLTNRTYRVDTDSGESYTVRIPGDGTESIIDRNNEMICSKLASNLKLDSNLLYFDNKGYKITEYITDAVTMDAALLREPSSIAECASILRKLHECGEDTGVPFDVFHMADIYEKSIFKSNVSMFEDYESMKRRVTHIYSSIQASGSIKKVPCHNDPLCENWIRGNNRLYLIDWEYSGMNDAMWDLAALSIEAVYEKTEDNLLMSSYLGCTPRSKDNEHLIAAKVFVDYLWTLWALMRTPYDGIPMMDWARERYDRMRHNIKLLE